MAAATRTPRQRASGPRGELTRGRIWLFPFIAEVVPSSCIARGVGVPASRLDCNIRVPQGLACGTHNALAVQSLLETPDAPARHHRRHLWHDRDAIARTVVLSGLGRSGYG